jgi:hypothetical protein
VRTRRAAKTVPALAAEIGLNCVGYKVRLVSRSVTSVFDEAFAPLGLKASQMNLLVTIARLGAPSAGSDRHRNGVSLTASGESLLVRAYPAWKKAQGAMLRKLGDQGRTALNMVMRKVRAPAPPEGETR